LTAVGAASALYVSDGSMAFREAVTAVYAWPLV
jgi:hypothetical protein